MAQQKQAQLLAEPMSERAHLISQLVVLGVAAVGAWAAIQYAGAHETLQAELALSVVMGGLFGASWLFLKVRREVRLFASGTPATATVLSVYERVRGRKYSSLQLRLLVREPGKEPYEVPAWAQVRPAHLEWIRPRSELAVRIDLSFPPLVAIDRTSVRSGDQVSH